MGTTHENEGDDPVVGEEPRDDVHAREVGERGRARIIPQRAEHGKYPDARHHDPEPRRVFLEQRRVERVVLY